jgi:hypothetical protein
MTLNSFVRRMALMGTVLTRMALNSFAEQALIVARMAQVLNAVEQVLNRRRHRHPDDVVH